VTPQQRAENISRLLGDDPVEDENQDLLDRGPFAGRVTELVEHVAGESPSAVLALLGPWGSGKTTVLHFVRRRLEGKDDWRVVEFNPWMVSDLPSLVQEFFTTLVAALPEDRKGRKLRRKLAGYAKAVSPYAAPFKFFGLSAQEATRTVGQVLEGDQSIEAQRRELEDALRRHDKPILFIADDLDRLHPEELTLIFKLVRLAATGRERRGSRSRRRTAPRTRRSGCWVPMIGTTPVGWRIAHANPDTVDEALFGGGK
jgi:predicted KAP-like P-loop ATPase